MIDSVTSPKSGYTLPVFACAGAIAALHQLITAAANGAPSALDHVTLDLVNPAESAEIPIEQSALISPHGALAITRSDPGDNLDLTRHTPIWSIVSWAEADQRDPIVLEGGEGIGQHDQGAAIYAYARTLMSANLSGLLDAEQKIKVTIVLPEGRRLALRTSNAAFGVVDGLSLLGTSGVAQPLSAPGQLESYRQTLRQKAAEYSDLVFCLGENGLDLALKHGIEPARRLKTANWMGPLLVEAGALGVRSILLFGYHGKLVKLAGGIFHTHHHVADARAEIMSACCVQAGLESAIAQQILMSATTEDALGILRKLDRQTQGGWVEKVYGIMADRIDKRSRQYIQTHGSPAVQVGSILFDRQRRIVIKSQAGQKMLP
ncbi:MAG: cobalt-precorrin-5B (C(1))-methyltransferase CbiD [Phormidesmis sp.]